MADQTDNESITELVPKTLVKYFESQISDLRDVFYDFPDPNDRIDLPSISAFVSSSDYRANPYPYPKKPTQDSDVTNSSAIIDYVVGYYDFNIQMDLWAASKEELDDMYDQVFLALHPNLPSQGLTLTMEDYFEQLCEYTYVSHDRSNAENEAQTDTWRITFTLLANCKAIISKREFVIEDTTIDAEINKDVLIVE